MFYSHFNAPELVAAIKVASFNQLFDKFGISHSNQSLISSLNKLVSFILHQLNLHKILYEFK